MRPALPPLLPSLALLALMAACLPLGGEDEIRLGGDTMGTTWSVTISDPPSTVTAEGLGERIETTLADVNAKMSNWDPNSEISLFNARQDTAPVPISAPLAAVMAEAMAVHALSGGRFDVTLAPLIDLWGFGPRRPEDAVPDEAAIAAALASVGQAEMVVLGDGTMAKARPDVTVNLSAIAKGYGVDRVAETLRSAGVENYIVEIGGDLAAQGVNAEGAPWSIGIERPDAAERSVAEILRLSDAGMATSGDYRNYFEEDGVRYSHILDPTTGRPITHRTASVTAVAETAMRADALATAFLALGTEDGLPLADANGLAILFITRGEGGFVTVPSAAMAALLGDNDG